MIDMVLLAEKVKLRGFVLEGRFCIDLGGYRDEFVTYFEAFFCV